jgi:hypothetical protein
MANRVTTKDILASASHFNGDIFEWDYKNCSDNTTNNQKKGIKVSYDTTWVPLLFKKLNEDKTVTKIQIKALDFENIVVKSRPSKPTNNDDDKSAANKVKCMLMAFQEMTLEEIRTGDYVPKVKDTPEEQAAEDKRMEDMTLLLFNNTKEFTDTLAAIADGFEKLCENIKDQYVENPESFTFNMAKEQNWVIKDKTKTKITMYNPPIRSIRQTHRKDEKNANNLILLDKPLYRLKMPVCDNKMLLSWRSKSGGQETAEYIYDARKTIIDRRTGRSTLVPARIKNAINGTPGQLTTDNVGDFIRYKSIISGHFEGFFVGLQGSTSYCNSLHGIG